LEAFQVDRDPAGELNNFALNCTSKKTATRSIAKSA
jgi:hypothetical protein